MFSLNELLDAWIIEIEILVQLNGWLYHMRYKVSRWLIAIKCFFLIIVKILPVLFMMHDAFKVKYNYTS